MTDLKQISFSLEIKNITDEMIQRFGFSESLAAIKFGFAYALKFHQNELSLDEPDRNTENTGRGLDYSVSSFSDNEILNIISALYPEIETPFRFLRNTCIIGLRHIKSKMDNNLNIEITDLM